MPTYSVNAQLTITIAQKDLDELAAIAASEGETFSLDQAIWDTIASALQDDREISLAHLFECEEIV